MTKLTELLNQIEPKSNARFCMSGGNCGTIYLGKNDAEGYAEFAVGPSNYSMDEGYFGDFCWGKDGDENIVFYYKGTKKDFTENKLANLILADFNKVKADN